MPDCNGYAAHDATGPMRPLRFKRRALRPDDVHIAIRYCGVCHSDLHCVRNDWQSTIYPCVPGHEIVGHVRAVGPAVTRFAVGDAVAVGCLVDSCRECDACRAGNELECTSGATLTYNGRDRHDGSLTFGGYSSDIVVRDAFVYRVPAGLALAHVAPLLCAGITTWSPLRQWRAGPGKRVAVAGLGGLGHMAVKLACALGAEVTVITRSAAKDAEARRLGAHRVLTATELPDCNHRFEIIIDTVPVPHDLSQHLSVLANAGVLVLVGAIDRVPPFHAGLLMQGRRLLTAFAIGGVPETREMLDFCATHGIAADCELISIQAIDAAFERLARGDVRYRFVVDLATLEQSHTSS